MRAEKLEKLPSSDRRAVAKHVARIIHVANQSRGTFRLDDKPFSPAQIAEAMSHLSHPDVYTLVSRDANNNAVAGGSIRFVPEQGAEITYVHSTVGAERHGYARDVLAGLLTHARKEGVLPAYLYVNPDNEPAVALYGAAKFHVAPRPVGDRMIPGWLRMEIDDMETLEASIDFLASDTHVHQDSA